MIKRLDFIEWARANGHSKTQVPMNLLEMILEYQKYVENEFKNLDRQCVSNFVLLAKANYKAKDGTIKRGIEINGKYYAPQNDC